MFKNIAFISLYDQHAFGVRSLHSALKQSGAGSSCIFYKYFTFEMRPSGEKELSLLINLLKDLSADIVGISVPSSFFAEAKKITLRIKKTLGTPVAWGGMHPTLRPRVCADIADFVFSGESDRVFPEFAEKGPSGNIPGLWFRHKGQIINGRPPEIITDLDALPITDFSSEGKYYIEDGGLAYGDPVYSRERFSSEWQNIYRTLTSRGCPFDCYYCGNQALKASYPDKNYPLRRRGVQAVIRELQLAKKDLGAKTIIFMDECFAVDRQWTKEFCGAYKKEICLPFHCEMHPNLISVDLLSELRGAGLTSTSLGIQSGSERIRKYYFNRNTNDGDLIKKAELIRKFGINLHFEIITDNPYENNADKQKTINLLLNMPRPLRLNVFSLNFFPGTKITDTALKDGLISEKDIEGNPDKGPSKFILKKPSWAKDKFLNYIYYLSADYYCASGNTRGLRRYFSDKTVLSVSKSRFVRGCLPILSIIIVFGQIRKFFRIINNHIPKDPLLFLRILAFSSLFPLAARILTPKIIFKLVKSRPGDKPDTRKIDRTIAYVKSILTLAPYRRIKNICLLRSTTLFYFLREAGIEDIRINFGIRGKDSGLIGHSWLTRQDKPYLENPQVCDDFAFIYSFPDEQKEK